MKKKTVLFMLIIASFLVGFGTVSVTLFHKSKVIDLSKAIELARPGGDGKNNETNVTDNPSKDVEDDTQEAESDKPSNAIVNIVVNGKTITIDGEEVKDVLESEKKIRNMYSPEKTFVLIDDYAEAKTYKGLISLLESLHDKIDLKYSIQS